MNYSIYSIATITGAENLHDGLYVLFPLVYFSENASSTNNTASHLVIEPENQNGTDNVDNASSAQLENSIDARDEITSAYVEGHENRQPPNGDDENDQDSESSSDSGNIIELTYKNFINILRIWKKGQKVSLLEIKAYFESENIKVSMNQIRRLIFIAIKKKNIKKYGKTGQKTYKIV